MKRLEYVLDQPATELLQGALHDCDSNTVWTLLKGFGPYDFIGGFNREITQGERKFRLPVGTLNEAYRIWCVGAPHDGRREPPGWNFQMDQVWRGKEIKRSFIEGM